MQDSRISKIRDTSTSTEKNTLSRTISMMTRGPCSLPDHRRSVKKTRGIVFVHEHKIKTRSIRTRVRYDHSRFGIFGARPFAIAIFSPYDHRRGTRASKQARTQVHTHTHTRLCPRTDLHMQARTHARTYTHVGGQRRVGVENVRVDHWDEFRTRKKDTDETRRSADRRGSRRYDRRRRAIATGVVRGAPFPRSAGKVDTVVGVELGDILSAHGRNLFAIASRRVFPRDPL